MKLFFFNPEHDLALANNHSNFVAPLSARKMASDLEMLPLWRAGKGDAVLAHRAVACRAWLEDMAEFWPACLREHLEQVRLLDTDEAVHESGIDQLVPWGWNRMTVSRMRQQGFADCLLPDCEHLEKWRMFSGRKTAVDVLSEVRGRFAVSGEDADRWLCGESRYCCTEKDIETELKRFDETILKAPWSGSGKGLRLGKGEYVPPLSGWCRRLLREQGGVVVEPYYNKVVDFAFEYWADGSNKLMYAGLSVFKTTHQGAYAGNWLAPEHVLWDYLGQYVPQDVLRSVEACLRSILGRKLGGVYNGPLGVDLMICRDDMGRYRVHPCVEVNLRQTMGLVAVELNRWLSEGSSGRFVVEYFSDERQLEEDHRKQMAEFPVRSGTDGKLQSGYLSLTPVLPGTCYRAGLWVTNEP